jgi:predicted transcriptional regulator
MTGLENVKVRDWMTSPVISVQPGTPISSVHQLMKEHSIRRVPVVEHDRVVGIVTLGDVREASPSDATTLSIWEMNYLWAQLTVEKVMSRKLFTVHPEDLILDTAQIMLDKKISGLPVLDDRGYLVGIITESDIFRMLVESRTRELNPNP